MLCFGHIGFARCWVLALGLTSLLPGRSSAAERVPQTDAPFLFRAWRTEDGLPHNSVNAITQTRDGYLWLGTDQGLARFDGVHCRTFGLADGLRSLQISALLEDSQGALWVGTFGGGLSRIANGTVKTFTTANSLAGDTVNALLEDDLGVLWIGTATGLSRWQNGAFLPAITNAPGDRFIRALAKEPGGAVWIAMLDDGLSCCRDGRFAIVRGPTNAPIIRAYSLLVDASGTLWASLRAGGILRRDTNTWTQFGPAQGMPSVFINSLAQSPDGTIWAGSLDEGLYYLRTSEKQEAESSKQKYAGGRAGQFVALRETDGLASDAIRSLYVDREQNLWVGTRAGGLNRLTPRKLSTIWVLEGTAERLPIALAQTADGELWVGTSGRGLFRWHGRQFEQFLRGPPIESHQFVEALLGTRDGALWWGAGPALFEWRDGHLAAAYALLPWLRRDRVLALCEDGQGGLWIGTHNGQLQHLRNGEFHPVRGLPAKPVSALAQQPDGTLWIGTLGAGLIRRQAESTSTFTSTNGLPSDLIRTLLLDRQGTLWIGTVGGGLSRWQAGHLDSFAAAQGLLDDSIAQIVDDDAGNLWLGCNRGIQRVSKQALADVAAKKISVVHPFVFGRREGMLSEQCVGGFGAALKLHSGELCFATARGIVVIDPHGQTGNAPPPAVLLQAVLIDGKAQRGNFQAPGRSADVPRIPPGKQRFEFHYTGLSFGAPDRVRFKYQLEGLDPDWVQAEESRSAIYAHVPPGQYRFKVIACNSDGLWNEVGATAAFIVLPHVWQRGWFIGLGALGFVGLTAGVIRGLERRRYHRRLRRLEFERAMDHERARIARDLHDELGSSLTRISLLSDLASVRDGSPDQLKAQVRKISDFAVRTTQALDQIVWAVNPRNDSLRSLLEYLTQLGRELFEDTPINCRFQIPDNLPDFPLPPEMRHNVFLVVKEAFNNALKHSKARVVSLQAQANQSQIEIVVVDDGAGFDLGVGESKNQRSGLRNMRERIESLGGRCEIETGLGRGTRVTLLLRRGFIIHNS